MYPNQYISKLIETEISAETMTNKFYNALVEKSTDIDDKKMLKEISMDEEKHRKMLTQLYTELNGKKPEIKEEDIQIINTLCENFANAIGAELDTVEKYRVLLFAFEKAEYKNMIMEIIFDEQNHAAKLNYLYSKNKN